MAHTAWIATDPIDLTAMLASVSGPTHGAVASFVGQVRDHDPEATGEVVALRYTCHPDAQRFIEEIVSATVVRHDPQGLAEAFIVADVAAADTVTVTRTTYHKCGRCWRHLPDVAADGELCGRCAEVVAHG